MKGFKMSIPKIIHYCWFGGNELPDNVIKCIKSWEKYCPDYQIIRWDESNYDYKKVSFTAEAYSVKKWAFVSDVARLDIISKYGGIYLDTDVELVKSLDPFLVNCAFMAFEQGRNVATGLGFGAEKGNKIIIQNLDLYKNLHFINSDGTYNLKPCPQYTTELLISLGLHKEDTLQVIDNMKIYPSEYFCPMLLSRGKAEITNNTVSIHHYDGTWTTDEDKKYLNRRIWIYTHFGRKGRRIYDGILLLKVNGFKSFFRRLYEIICEG